VLSNDHMSKAVQSYVQNRQRTKMAHKSSHNRNKRVEKEIMWHVLDLDYGRFWFMGHFGHCRLQEAADWSVSTNCYNGKDRVIIAGVV